MKLWYQGDKSKALCEHCQTLVSTTFGYHDVPFSDSIGLAKNIMAATCDTCGTIVSIPPQSTPSIAAARQTANQSLEFKLEAPFLEILDLATLRLDAGAGIHLRKPLIAFFVKRRLNEDGGVQRLKDGLQQHCSTWDAWKAMPRKRLSIKVTPKFSAEFQELAERCNMSKTTLVQSICMDIGSEVVAPTEPKILPELKQVMAVVAA